MCILASRTDDIIQFWAGNYQPMPERRKNLIVIKYLSVIPAEDIYRRDGKMLPHEAPIDLDSLL